MMCARLKDEPILLEPWEIKRELSNHQKLTQGLSAGCAQPGTLTA